MTALTTTSKDSSHLKPIMGENSSNITLLSIHGPGRVTAQLDTLLEDNRTNNSVNVPSST